MGELMERNLEFGPLFFCGLCMRLAALRIICASSFMRNSWFKTDHLRLGQNKMFGLCVASFRLFGSKRISFQGSDFLLFYECQWWTKHAGMKHSFVSKSPEYLQTCKRSELGRTRWTGRDVKLRTA